MAGLDATDLKIRRARTHIAELQGVCDEFLKGQPLIWHKFEPHINPDGTVGISVDVKPQPMPEHVPAIMGDIVHNLRVSLDLLASDLAVANGKSPKGIHFPFANSAEELPQQIADKGFDRCGEEAATLLQNSVKPFRGGDDLLRAIHDLDIIDKHRALLPFPYAAALMHIPIVGEDANGQPILGMPYKEDVPPPIFFDYLGDNNPVELFDLLDKMASLCVDIRAKFAPVYERLVGENAQD